MKKLDMEVRVLRDIFVVNMYIKDGDYDNISKEQKLELEKIIGRKEENWNIDIRDEGEMWIWKRKVDM